MPLRCRSLRVNTRRMARFARLSIALICVILATGACGDAEVAGYEVSSETVSNESTQDILVLTPESQGSWPVVMLLHGLGGVGEAMAETGARLAEHGLVVFAPTYRTDMSTEQGMTDLESDLTCAYRFAMANADQYNGDLDQPIAFVGWSLGATFALEGGLTNEEPPISCGVEVPLPDIVVPISGCHYQFEESQFDFDPSDWGNRDAKVLLIAGDEDKTCAAWQSEDAAAELRAAGYDVHLVILEGADHPAPVFHEFVDGEFVLTPDDPAGAQTVDLIVDAINS
jgi:dienelactone hydrolase